MYELEIAYKVVVKMLTILSPCIISGAIGASLVLIFMRKY